MRDAAHRAIAGFSTGGYRAVNIAMRNPGVFGQVVSIAGYFAANDPSGMAGGGAPVVAKNTPSAHPCQAWGKPAPAADRRGLRVLLDEDASEPSPLVRGQAARMGARLRSCGVQAAVRVQPGARNLAYAVTALRQAFAFLTAGWRQAAADDADGSGFWAAALGRPR
jgi:putative esterase